ncbi:hypothetical protein EG327_008673 [Venturia inaequalis]|uniref:Uncharacterized protein n=1 Tax=Venturia inaequalis TaxID=5025 RepID=A0A8H3VQ88_VENIN|nr:hypothetical protein EG327_008673 [Venturia inaequalis]
MAVVQNNVKLMDEILLQVGSQFESGGMTGNRHRHLVTTPQCPHHHAVLQGHVLDQKRATGIARFLSEGPGEQHAMFIRPDTGMPSTSRLCRCGE